MNFLIKTSQLSILDTWIWVRDRLCIKYKIMILKISRPKDLNKLIEIDIKSIWSRNQPPRMRTKRSRQILEFSAARDRIISNLRTGTQVNEMVWLKLLQSVPWLIVYTTENRSTYKKRRGMLHVTTIHNLLKNTPPMPICLPVILLAATFVLFCFSPAPHANL